MRAAPVLQGVRAGVFAALCVALAAAAHTLSMDATPTLATMTAACAAVFALSFLAASRERSLAGICGAMALVQVGLHLLFNATTPPSAMPAMPAMANMPAMPGMAAAHHAMSLPAVAAHALAALAAAWWLRRGEAAVWSLLRRAAALTPGLTAWTRAHAVPPAMPPAVPAPGHVRGCGPRFPLLLRHAVIRRGPPPQGPLPVPTV